MTKTILITALLSVLPISELRGAIPYAYFNGKNIWESFALGVFFNALVAPLGFIFFTTVNKVLCKIKPYRILFEKTVERARKKVSKNIEKYGLIGLLIFVAIPLPVTGAWTGTIGAWILGLDRKKSIAYIFFGVIIAGIIVTTIIYAGVGINSIFVKQV